MTGMAPRLDAALAQTQRLAGFEHRVWDLHTRRTAAVAKFPRWEELRQRAAAIKAHTLSKLDHYLEQFVENAQAAGAVVHFARDGDQANGIIADLCQQRGARSVTKSKSMTTEECHLNDFLQDLGIEIVDTDLGERIVQMLKEPPSHIVAPALHRTAEEIGELFAQQLGTPPGEKDPGRLTAAARVHLRPFFLGAQLGITGVNFAIAETGTITVVENEGNSLLTTSIPDVHIAVMGIEKVIPRMADLGTFLNLLARSATGQRISIYTTHYTGPQRRGEARQRELHIVVLDNGRSRLLSQAGHASSLACIRCGACLNVCPVYRRSLGHAYGWVYSGPIGSVLSPVMGGPGGAELPMASTLCGACTEVCPVKIDLHQQLLRWRGEMVAAGRVPRPYIGILARVFRHPTLFRALAQLAIRANRWPWLQRRVLGKWMGLQDGAVKRAPPPPAEKSFSRWWRDRQGSQP
jgi:L-lactate dehydrogenase complex protein LldF